MEQPVTVKFRWSADDLYQGLCYHQRQRCRRVIRTLLRATIYTLAVLSCVGGIFAHRAGEPWTPYLIFPVLAVCWWSQPFWQRRLVWRQFAKRPDKGVEVEWQISPDELSTRAPHAYSEFGW